MKFLIVAALALVALATAAPADSYQDAVVVRSLYDQQPDGAYVYDVETSDGKKQQETGELKQLLDEDNKPQNVIVVRGSFEYTDKDGQRHTVTYIADENGFQPQSDDIPVGPAPVRR